MKGYMPVRIPYPPALGMLWSIDGGSGDENQSKQLVDLQRPVNRSHARSTNGMSDSLVKHCLEVLYLDWFFCLCACPLMPAKGQQ